MKISRNPVLAYRQGENAGCLNGMKAALYLFGVAGMNVSEEAFGEDEDAYWTFYKKMEAETMRMLEEISGDVDDNSMLIAAKTEAIRKAHGLPDLSKKEW